MRIRPFSALAFLTAFAVLPLSAAAHAENIYLEEKAPPYIVDLESDVYVLEAGTVSNFAISLLDPDTLDKPPFDFVRAEIVQDGRIISDQKIPREAFVPESLAFDFPENGSYSLRLGFHRGGKAVASAEFALLVGKDMFASSMTPTGAEYPSASAPSFSRQAGIVILGILAAGSAFAILRARSIL